MYAGGPAEKSGKVKVGDVLVAVDGHNVSQHLCGAHHRRRHSARPFLPPPIHPRPARCSHIRATTQHAKCNHLQLAPHYIPDTAIDTIFSQVRDRSCTQTQRPTGASPLHSAPHTLRPTPYTLHPTPYTLHPTPYTLHPPPYTLHPTPYTLHSRTTVHGCREVCPPPHQHPSP